MVGYVLKRLLQFIPSLILITFLGFLISGYAPVDPAERLTGRAMEGGKALTAAQQETILREHRRKLGLDLPMFYFSVGTLAEPDTIDRVADRDERRMLRKLVDMYGNWEEVSKYYNYLALFPSECPTVFEVIDKKAMQQNRVVSDSIITVCPTAPWINVPIDSLDKDKIQNAHSLIYSKIKTLKTNTDDNVIRKEISEIDSIIKAEELPSYYIYYLDDVPELYFRLVNSATTWKNYIPSFSFNPDNRYHRWLFGDGESAHGILRGDFGLSYSTHEPVGNLIAARIGYTLFFSLMGIALAYLISIPLGVYAAVKKNSWFDRVSSVVLFLLYSMPSFWLATLLLMCFANPDVLYWFESSGIKPAEGYPNGASVFQKLSISLPYIVLPLICYTYSSLAFLSRTLRVSVLENIKQDYITTARAKGLPYRRVIWKHAFRNSLLPLITVLADVFPYAIGGSVILETVFTLPGMGFETYRAILGQDYPVIMAMLTLTAVLTIFGLLVQDILYAIADPRISFKQKK